MARDLDFIFVGTPKSGSTWLFDTLREHPEASLLASKSSGFFETHKPGSLDDYRTLLERECKNRVIGEIAHDAYLYPDTAARLRVAFPKVRIFICLREPGDFAESILKWWRTHTDRFGGSVAEMEAHPFFRRQTDYVGSLAPFFQLFPKGQVRTFFFDELSEDPARFYREVCGFIGIDPNFVPVSLRTIVNPARAPRVRGLTKIAYGAGGLARQLGLGALVESAKRSRAVARLIYSGAAPIDPEIRAAAIRVRARLSTQISCLEEIIGRPVPTAWGEF